MAGIRLSRYQALAIEGYEVTLSISLLGGWLGFYTAASCFYTLNFLIQGDKDVEFNALRGTNDPHWR